MPATTNVEASKSSVKQIDRLALEARLVRELDGGRAALPILPHVAAQAIRFANDPSSDLRKLAELVEADPPIAARLLAVANSVIYSRTARVSTTRVAIIRLGLEGTRDLLFQVVYASSTVGLPRYQDLVARSFRRSVLCGIAARLVSDKMRYRFEYDYLCGLLHDIGEARIYRILANYKEVIDPVVLQDLIMRYHRRAGAELAIAWGLPEPIIEACAHHHDDPAKATALVKMVMIADVLVDMVERRQVPEGGVASPALEVGHDAAAPSPHGTPEAPSSAVHSAASAIASDGEPGPTDPGAALGPTSAVWPTNLNDPPGAPDPKSATWATKVDPPAEASSPKISVRPELVAPPGVTPPPSASSEARSEPNREDADVADFARLAALGMARDLAETILSKLEESTAEIPL
jgi:HD-like signal output (HDOD) protein